ncbi:MAG: tetratricopeptide repeat protein [Acidothermaceae bacterium]
MQDSHPTEPERFDTVGRDSDGELVPDGELPDGEGAYDWYTRGLELLDARSSAAAAQVLARAAEAEPHSRSILEALGRAQFESRRYAAARETFAKIIAVNPADDYAHFALGLSAARTGDLRVAVEHLALAAAMRPDIAHYGRELRIARARFEGAS